MEQIQWPKGELIPKSFEEARELGWKPSYRINLNIKPCFSPKCGNDLPTCNVLLEKEIGLVTLYVELQTTIRFSDQFQLHNPKAYEHEPEPVKPKREQLFDVTYYLPKRSIRVLALDKEHANDLAADYAGFSWTATPAKSNSRLVPVYDAYGLVQAAGKRATK